MVLIRRGVLFSDPEHHGPHVRPSPCTGPVTAQDANAKLEFGLSNSLTKDISAAERALKSAIKKAKKAYKNLSETNSR